MKNSQGSPLSIVENQCQTLHLDQDIFDSKIRALRKRAIIESKLISGAENFLKVAVGDQRIKALRELEESRNRLETCQALLSVYRAYSPKVSWSSIVASYDGGPLAHVLPLLFIIRVYRSLSMM